MPVLRFTQHLARYADASPFEATGSSLAEAMACLFAARPQLKSYLVDEAGTLRPHVVVYIDGQPSRDRKALSDQLAPDAVVDVLQALSGG